MKEIADGEPRPGSELVVGSVRNVGDGAPFLDGLFGVSLPLKQDGGGDRPVDRGRRGIHLGASHGPVGLVRFRRGTLGGYSLHQRSGLVALRRDLADQFPRLFGMFSGLVDVPACFGFDLTEPLEAEIADENGNDAKQRQEDGNPHEPPVDELHAAIQQFAPQVVEVAPQVIFGVSCVVPAGFVRRLRSGSNGRNGRFRRGRRRLGSDVRGSHGHDRREGQAGGDGRARASGRRFCHA